MVPKLHNMDVGHCKGLLQCCNQTSVILGNLVVGAAGAVAVVLAVALAAQLAARSVHKVWMSWVTWS